MTLDETSGEDGAAAVLLLKTHAEERLLLREFPYEYARYSSGWRN
jgi:protein-S-isoprenylcysteine O-methyltransferase Ste14